MLQHEAEEGGVVLKGQVEITELGLTLADGRPESIRYAALYWMETHYGPFGDLLHTALTGEPAFTRYYGRPFFDFSWVDVGILAAWGVVGLMLAVRFFSWEPRR